MKNLKNITFTIVIAIIINALLGFNVSKAATTTLSATSKTIKSGETFTVSVSSSIKLSGWTISLSDSGNITFNSASGGEVNGKSVYGTSVEGTTALATYSFKAPEVTKDTTYKLTFSGTEMCDATDDINDVSSTSCTATITVKAKEQDNTENSNTTTGGNTSTENNTTTGGNNTTSGNNNTTGGNTTSSGNSSSTNEYKPTFTEKNETVYATATVNVRQSYSTSSAILGSLSKDKSVERTGVSTDGKWSRVKYNGQTAYISSTYLTTTKPEEPKEEEKEKSSNKNLASLKIKDVELSPKFDAETTQYTATVSTDITKLEITAKAEDSKAKVEIIDNNELKLGDNIIKIKVTAENNTVRTYMITVTKQDETEEGETTEVSTDELKLSSLQIANVNFEQGFNPDIYTYELALNDGTITNLNIVATPNQEGAQVEIIGNQNFVVGSNTVTVLLTSADGTKTATYQIKVILPEQTEQEPQSEIDMFYIIAAGVAVIIIISIIVLIVTRDKGEEEDFNNEETSNQEQEEVAPEKKEKSKRQKGKHSN